jgi:hypothetical protein
VFARSGAFHVHPSPTSQRSRPTISECPGVYGNGYLHFIIASYRREPLLGTAYRKDLFVKVLEQVRQRYEFVVVGYVVVPV